MSTGPETGARAGGNGTRAGRRALFRAEALRHHARRGRYGEPVRVRRFRRRRIPFVAGFSESDCAAACLAMVLAAHGRRVPLGTVRAALGRSAGGATARDIVDAAERWGLSGRGLRLSLGDLRFLPPGSILHWGFDHFVVFERATRRGAVVVDPSFGRRKVSRELLRREFTGVALVFEPRPCPAAVPSSRRRHWLLPLLWRHKGRVAVCLALTLAVQLGALAVPLLTGSLVDRIAPGAKSAVLVAFVAGLLGVAAGSALATLARGRALVALRTLLEERLSTAFVEHLARLPYAFFLAHSSGDLLTRLASNRVVRDALTGAVLSGLLDALFAAVHLAALAWIWPPAGAIALSAGAAQAVLLAASRRRERELAASELESRAREQGELVEMLAGMETLKALGAESEAVRSWAQRYAEELNAALARGRLESWVEAAGLLVRQAAPAAVLGGAGVAVLDGRLSVGTMLALSMLAGGFLAPLAGMLATGLSLARLRSHTERIAEVLETPADSSPAPSAAPPVLRGGVELRRVSFRYGEREPWVLRDVSLAIRPGERVAIVGRSGAGKTTLARLVVGLLDPVEGEILYDGVPRRAFDPGALRQRMGIVPQRPYVFAASVAANVSLGDPRCTRERIVEAARLAGIHEEIAALPLGYDTVLPDGGRSLSGGQRQRLALARVFARRPALVVLDEATSELDALGERAVVDRLRSMRVTQIVIAHRLSTVADADRIVVLERGRIAETGTHAELLAHGRIYPRLVAAQMSPATARS
ncbi:MAG: peptidase domain-containing ABC transporter [Acidobacteria bacterium]|nr:MAG: peptidase domain-containing ABC transporter [Acidobacteriota bacterium]